ncbi:hypothetical protein MKZ38_009241 [Zalerion maritima]|uniref:BAR domain-containing protein n=1 Tax=Zalerion maritima TaxID=339359 RepID=A0AAD5RVF6_9PEZI|nr:hypothetical protein MKZ38_009241 [Zalerion maritima]
MNFTKKMDRAFQWAGEKMGGDAHTNMPDEFKNLEIEMALRFKGMEKLQRSMSSYVKWLSSKGESFGPEKDKGAPSTHLGRVMTTHGEDFEPDSEFGACLIAMGRANERVASLQEHYTANATSHWLESLERSLAQMKEYQNARKKLESRRLAYDASMGKVNKAKREDFRLEEELRANKAKYEESSEDVLRRMQDIKEAERESINDVGMFLDVELDYHERCAEELRRARQNWPARSGSALSSPTNPRQRNGLSRTNTTSSYGAPLSRNQSRSTMYDEDREPPPEPVRMPMRSTSRMSLHSNASSAVPDLPLRPCLSRSSTIQSERRPAPTPPPMVSNAAALRGQLRPVNPPSRSTPNVFADDDSPRSSAGSPEWGERIDSPATSFGSGGFERTNSTTSINTNGIGTDRKKAPPPPPPSRSKKPPPPVPARRPGLY